jgi:hypothetical protein
MESDCVIANLLAEITTGGNQPVLSGQQIGTATDLGIKLCIAVKGRLQTTCLPMKRKAMTSKNPYVRILWPKKLRCKLGVY